MQHQRKQPNDFRLGRHQLQHQSAKVDRFFRETLASRVGAGHVIPSAAVCRIDRFENRIDARGQIVFMRQFERDARVADLGLRTRQTLAHRLWLDEERGCDTRRVEPEHGLQHQRRSRRGVDRGMRANEEQLQALVGEVHVRCRSVFGFFGDHRQPEAALLPYLYEVSFGYGDVDFYNAADTHTTGERFMTEVMREELGKLGSSETWKWGGSKVRRLMNRPLSKN